MVQSPSWEANGFAANQEISLISRIPKVHYRTHKRPPPLSILGQPNPVHIPTAHLLEIHPNIIHPSMPMSPQWSLVHLVGFIIRAQYSWDINHRSYKTATCFFAEVSISGSYKYRRSISANTSVFVELGTPVVLLTPWGWARCRNTQQFFITCMICILLCAFVDEYSQALHDDVSVNDGPHIRRWSHNIIILTTVLQLPTVFSTVTCCTGL